MVENMKKKKNIGNALIVVGLLLMGIPLLIDIIVPPVMIAGLIITCIGFIYFLIFWRCPFCRKQLPFQGMFGMEYCPYCGNKIDD